jgi:hypothetical protein
MKLSEIIIIIILVVSVLYLCKENINRLKLNYNPSQDELQNLVYVDKKTFNDKYPYPQISRSFKKLSTSFLPQSNNNSEIFPKPSDNYQFLRNITTSDNINKERVYLPEYYRKDTLNADNINSEEYRPFINDESVSETSWTDENVSQNPKFYNSDIKNELTNIGSFFDINNQYHDKTSTNTLTLPSDECYIDKNNNIICNDNSRLQLIPPKLITDNNKCTALNTIGKYKDQDLYLNKEEKTINGGKFYNDITGVTNINKYYSSTMKDELNSCVI